MTYASARGTIDDFRQRMNERLQNLEKRIEALDQKLENLAPGSPEYKRLTKERDEAQRKQQDLWDYKNDVIRPMEDRMNDPDNPPSKADLDMFNDRVRRDMDTIFAPVVTSPDSKPDEPTGIDTANLDIPKL
ncbi:MAG: hypothetical protein RIB80_09860 [Rhodospirillales bacterium]